MPLSWFHPTYHAVPELLLEPIAMTFTLRAGANNQNLCRERYHALEDR